eukprot:UN10617
MGNAMRECLNGSVELCADCGDPYASDEEMSGEDEIDDSSSDYYDNVESNEELIREYGLGDSSFFTSYANISDLAYSTSATNINAPTRVNNQKMLSFLRDIELSDSDFTKLVRGHYRNDGSIDTAQLLQIIYKIAQCAEVDIDQQETHALNLVEWIEEHKLRPGSRRSSLTKQTSRETLSVWIEGYARSFTRHDRRKTL